MRWWFIIFVQVTIYFSHSTCEISENVQRIVNVYINFLNLSPDNPYTYGEPVLTKYQETQKNEYCLELKIKATDVQNVYSYKYLNCSVIINDEGLKPEVHNSYCEDYIESVTENIEELVTDLTTGDVTDFTTGDGEVTAADNFVVSTNKDGPIQLENEVQPSDAVPTSGEQFIAIPRERAGPCIGCSSFVNLDAPGVQDLANLGIKQLDRHEPNTRHSLDTLLRVERQVQVVGGIRYIVTAIINYDTCTVHDKNDDACLYKKTCQISVLEKPWKKAADGSKFRAILANNCTEDWIFSETTTEDQNSSLDNNVVPTTPFPTSNSESDKIEVKHNVEVQAQPNEEKTIITDQQLKELEEQIIPYNANEVNQQNANRESDVLTDELNTQLHSKVRHVNSEAIASTDTVENSDQSNKGDQKDFSILSEDQKKAIDEFSNFFDFTGIKPSSTQNDNIRIKRDYGNDLEVLAMAKNFQDMQKKVKNALYIHKLAQVMVDYLNELDIEVKNRILKEVVSAEEEFENNHKYFYLQAEVAVPCDTTDCKTKFKDVKSCTGVIDVNGEYPKVVYSICYDENKRSKGKFRTVRTNDIILLKLVYGSIKEIEQTSEISYARRIKKILSASTQQNLGTLVKVTAEIEYLSCDKSLSLYQRANCSNKEKMGTQICDFDIYMDQDWNEKKVSHSCTDRPAGESVSSAERNILLPSSNNMTNVEILEIIQEAIQYLEIKSNRNSKQKLVEIKSATQQTVAGLLTTVIFVVGYTNCKNDYKEDLALCNVLDNEPLRNCSVEHWDRPWLEDGKQVKVTCEDMSDRIMAIKSSKIRSKRSSDLYFVGGQTEADITDSKYKTLAEESMQKFVQSTGSNQHYQVVHIEKVTVQVVSGKLTRIDFRISPTNCQVDASGRPKSSDCVVQEGAEVINCHSSIWEKQWLKSKEIDVECNVGSKKTVKKRSIEFNEIMGNEIIENPKEQKYTEYAEDALKSYLTIFPQDQYYIVSRVETVKKVDAPDEFIKIDFTAVSTNCTSLSGIPTSSPCVQQDPANTMSCHVEIQTKPPFSNRMINVYCQIDEEKLRKRRQLGGVVEKSVTDPLYRQLAEESIARYVSKSGLSQYHKVIKIYKVSTQVVSGTLTYIDFKVAPTECQVNSEGLPSSSDCVVKRSGLLKCHADIWQQPWLSKKEITVKCSPIKRRSRRETTRSIKGGLRHRDPKNADYQKMAEESLAKYVITSGINQYHEVVEIEKVTTQVVSGLITRLQFKASATNCLLNEEGRPTSLVCEINDNNQILRCHAKIWEQSWLNKKDINVTCEPAVIRDKRSLAGGVKLQDRNDPQFFKLAEESLAKYITSSGISQYHKPIEIVKATTQVVSGSLTKIHFRASETNCSADGNGHPTGSKCEILDPQSTFECHSVIWEQPWLNKKDINVTCSPETLRQKRQLPGGETIVDSNDPKYLKLAEESLSQYVTCSGISEHHQILEITKVLTQVVSGKLTKIYFDATPTNCVVDSNGKPTSTVCEIKNPKNTISCHADIWERPWLNKKEITVDCTPGKSRTKRQIPGGESTEDPKNAIYLKLAEESLTKYVASSGISQYHKPVEIVKVTTQVVSGSLTKIHFRASETNCSADGNGQPTSSKCEILNPQSSFECHSVIWEQTWLNKKDINVTCEPAVTRNKRSLAGGVKLQDRNDPKFFKLAEESLAKYITSSGISQYNKPIEIMKATTQVVSGSLTKIHFRASETNCSADGNGQPTGSTCEILNPQRTFECHSVIWEQPWLNKKDINVTCSPETSRQKRQLPGGETIVDSNDPKYLKLAEESLSQYVTSSGISEHHQILEITKVLTQVVSGKLTKIYFDASPTNCVVDSNGKPTSTVCEIKNPKNTISCHADIWERPWLNKKEITVDCTPGKSRTKRQIPGGESTEDPKNAKYLKLAEESLAKYVTSSGITQHYQTFEVTKASEQVVSGKLTKLDFKAATTNCLVDSNGQPTSSDCNIQNLQNIIVCHAEIWEQQWLNKKEITITCTPHVISKRHALQHGGELAQDPNDPKLLELANKAMQKYSETAGYTELEHKIFEIEKVTTRIVSGQLTKIDFSITPSNCPSKNERTLNDRDCQILYCHSNIWEKLWLKNSTNIDITCNEFKNLKSSYNYYDLDGLGSEMVNTTISLADVRNKRAYTRIRSGGDQEQNPNLPIYKTYVLEALRKYQRKNKLESAHKLVKVNRVITRVVSGIIYKIDFTAIRTTCGVNVRNLEACESVQNGTLYCHTEIWDQPWLKRRKIEVACVDEDDTSSTELESEARTRKKRSIISINSRNEEVKNMDMTNNNNIDEIRKDDYFEYQNQSLNEDVIQRRNKYNTPYYKQLGEMALRKYEKVSMTDRLHKVVKVNYVSEKDDGGIRIDIHFTASPTSCSKDVLNSSDCQYLETKLNCDASIVFFVTMDQSEASIVEADCKNVSKRRRRRELGPIEEQEDIDDDVKFYYADKIVSKYNQMQDFSNLYKLVTVHDTRRTRHMHTPMVRMYVELAKTYCMRDGEETEISSCNEIEGISHKLCLARFWPSKYNDLVSNNMHVVCDDDEPSYTEIAGYHANDLIRYCIQVVNSQKIFPMYMRAAGDYYIVPSLDYNEPFKLSFLIVGTNCTYEEALETVRDLDRPGATDNAFNCEVNEDEGLTSCRSLVYLSPHTQEVEYANVSCQRQYRTKRSIQMNSVNKTDQDLTIEKLVQESLLKLEMESIHRYRQRVLTVNNYKTHIGDRGLETTIDFYVGYTNCLKFEWVDNITSCQFLEHLPRRHCVAHALERVFVHNGRSLDVRCADDETPLEASMELESAESAQLLANEALKRIEYKYPHPRKQKVVRIFSLEKQNTAGLHYKMKLEVGYTNCMALSENENCKFDADVGANKFCRVNVWARPWTTHPPSYRVSCDYSEGHADEIYHTLQAEQLFRHFLHTHNPPYINDYGQLRERFKVFRENLQKIHELNIYEMGTARYAVTRFADLTPEEFKKTYLGLDLGLRNENQVPLPAADIPTGEAPESFDWREHDAVTEVKDQGMCGSCWAFSVTGNIEGQWKKHSGKLVSLSEQELVDCDTLDSGCNGGLPDNAYRAIEQLGGLESESDYPYEGEKEKCEFNSTLSRVQISGAVNISSNETDMAKWLAANGPISIGINANAMQFYVGGISHPWRMLCNPKNLDHGVLIVGYGEKDYPLFKKKLPYWIVKNSWGKSWGEQGYYRVYRGDGTCGVNQMASSAVI